MHKAKRLKITDLNPHLTCVLCGGYFIEATTIIECLHSFCKTCIIRYLESNKFCPICDVQVHKTKPMMNIRADKTLQDIVYKLVPGLFQDEMKRRRECYTKTSPGSLGNTSPEDRGEVPDHRLIYSPDEPISLSLEYGYGKNQLPGENTVNGEADSNGQRRFLRCPAGITVLHLKKFVKLKYGLSPPFEVEMMYYEDSLEDDYTLMDLAYIYTWRRNEPMRLFYRIYQRPKKRPKPECPDTPAPTVTDTKDDLTSASDQEPSIPAEAIREVEPDPTPTPTPSCPVEKEETTTSMTTTSTTAATTTTTATVKEASTVTTAPPVAPVNPTPQMGVVLPTVVVKEPVKAVVKKLTIAEIKPKPVTERPPTGNVNNNNLIQPPASVETPPVPQPALPTPAPSSLTPEPSDGVPEPSDPSSVSSGTSSSDTSTTVTTTPAVSPAPSEPVTAPPTPPTTPVVVTVPSTVTVTTVQDSVPPPSRASAPEPGRNPFQEKKKPVTASVEPFPVAQVRPQPETAAPAFSAPAAQPSSRKEGSSKSSSLTKERKHSSDHHYHHYPPEKKKRVSDGRYSLEEKRKKEKRLNAISELLISLPRNNNNVSNNNNHHYHHNHHQERDKVGGSPPLVSSPKLAEPPVANATPAASSAPVPTQPPPIAPVTVVLDRKYKKEPHVEPARDDIGALDLSVSHRHDRPSGHVRPRHVANPAVLDKHRLVTCLPAPKYPSFKIVNTNPLSSSSSSSSSSFSKKSEGSRHRGKTLTVINPDPTKIVIKNLDVNNVRRDNHHHSQHHHHHHRH